ncbi:MAG: hypothetical protein R2877_01175, partial [Bdellovibrionota bacterium]
SFAKSASAQVPDFGANPVAMSEAFKVTKEKPYFGSPVKLDDGFAFIKLKNKTEADWKKFEVEHDNLADALHKQNAQTRFMAWMTNAEKNATIKRELGQSAPVGE